MHLAKLGQEQRQHHNSRDNRKLRGLKIDWPQTQPAARSINFDPHKLGHDQKHNAGKVHRQGTPANPPVVNQTRQHKREDTDDHPVCLFAPKVGRIRVSARCCRHSSAPDTLSPTPMPASRPPVAVTRASGIEDNGMGDNGIRSWSLQEHRGRA